MKDRVDGSQHDVLVGASVARDVVGVEQLVVVGRLVASGRQWDRIARIGVRIRH